MRISTNTLYSTNVTTLNNLQSQYLKTMQQITSGRKILTPADDPAGAAQALMVSQASAANAQYSKNIGMAQTALGMSDGVLSNVSSMLLDVRTTALNASSATNANRLSMAAALEQQLDSLLVYANSTDTTGAYLFSGYQGSTTPFAQSGSGVQYLGDDGQRNVQVNSTQVVSTSDSGAAIFMRIKNGNGTFATHAEAANTGTGSISFGNVTNSALVTGNSYRLDFHVSGGVTTYDVVNTTTNTAVSTGNAYTEGQNIAFDGMQFAITGAPADGDQFTVKPSTNESIFETISNLITLLKTPIPEGDKAAEAQLNNGLREAVNGMTRSIDNVSAVRASIGARMNALSSEKAASDSLELQYKQALSQLQDVDYNEAITNLTQQLTQLQAAQKVYLQISNLSVFNYL